MTNIAAVLAVLMIVSACKPSKKVTGDKEPQIGQTVTKTASPVSDITLSDKPLSVIQQHLIGPKWQMVYRVGGITGKDKEQFDNVYITFHKDHLMRYEGDAGKRQPDRLDRVGQWVDHGDPKYGGLRKCRSDRVGSVHLKGLTALPIRRLLSRLFIHEKTDSDLGCGNGFCDVGHSSETAERGVGDYG